MFTQSNQIIKNTSYFILFISIIFYASSLHAQTITSLLTENQYAHYTEKCVQPAHPDYFSGKDMKNGLHQHTNYLNEINLKTNIIEDYLNQISSQDVNQLSSNYYQIEKNNSDKNSINKATDKKFKNDKKNKFDNFNELSFDFIDDKAKGYEKIIKHLEKNESFKHKKQAENLSADWYNQQQQALHNYHQQLIFWYKLGAEKAHVDYQYKLALIYFEGSLAPKNYELAKYWFEQAANQGHPLAQYKLAEYYLWGYGITNINRVQAYKWLSLASTHLKQKQSQLKVLEWLMPNDKIEYAQQLTYFWCKRYGYKLSMD